MYNNRTVRKTGYFYANPVKYYTSVPYVHSSNIEHVLNGF